MSFGMFEANITSDDENKRQVREAASKLAAATYDVRERFGQFLFAARDLAEYSDRLALSKTDIIKTIEPHVFPRTGTVRRVLKPLETEFKELRQRTAMRYVADTGMQTNLDDVLFPGVSRPPGSTIKENPFADGGFDPSKIPGVTGGPNTPNPVDPTGGLLTNTLTPPASEPSPGAPSKPSSAAPTGPTPGVTPPTPGVTPPAPVGTADSTTTDSTGTAAGGAGDAIGAGKYEIQSGDTYSDLAQRAGWGDDYQGFANATGYQADNPDMIYAGDTIDVKAPGSDPATTSSTAPLAAEADTTPSPDMTSNSGSLTDPGLSAPGQELVGRRAALRRRADFDGELEPEGDFKGYLKSVDEGDEGRTTNNFGGTFPGGTDHSDDPAKTDFVKGATRRFASWCQANRVRPTLAALDHYGPSDREYIAIAAGLQRLAADSTQPASPGSPMANPTYNTDPGPLYGGPVSGDGVVSNDTGLPPSGPSVPNMTDVGMADAVGQGRITSRRRSATPGVPGSKPKGPEWTSKGKPKAPQGKPDLGTFDDRPNTNLPGGTPSSTLPGQGSMMNARRRTAAPDYLQKADEALTNLLNQKAEEFQQTIAPLQQALQTVQQAEQAAAAANPMSVLPPAGTVNVMPGGDPSGGAGGGMDPSALMGLMGGGDPSMGGGDPSMGGGMPPGLDPSAMGGDPSQQQMVARRGKARGAARPRQAKNVDQLWDEYTHQSTMRGGEPDVETFAQKYRVGPRALQRIRQKAMGG